LSKKNVGNVRESASTTKESVSVKTGKVSSECTAKGAQTTHVGNGWRCVQRRKGKTKIVRQKEQTQRGGEK